MALLSPNIVFLHIPKTAGQTIHSELVRAFGEKAISPVRVHTQAAQGAAQFPPGYQVYSGHIDWEALESVPQPRFVFTVLRDPLERIASFYFYLRRQAQSLSAQELANPARTGMRMILEKTADAYFMDGAPSWQKFILDHYHSPYCTYLATRRIRGFSEISGLSQEDLLARAQTGARHLDGIYSVDRLDLLETDLKARCGVDLRLTNRFVNADPEGRTRARWPKLDALLQDDSTRQQLRRFAAADQVLMARMGLVKDTVG